jgi:hypothetical protein
MSASDWLNHIRIRCTTELEAIRSELAYFERHRAPCVEERIAALKATQARMLAEKISLAKAIDQIPDPVARAIYRGRYIIGSDWRKVAENCGGMSVRNAHYIHDRWLPAVEKIYNETLKGE